MGDFLNILHVSDLHFSASSRKDIDKVCTCLFKDIAAFKHQGLTVDILAFTGDLVDKGGTDADYNSAKSLFIDGILKETGLPIHRFFIVPGNHDIQRNKINRIVEAGLKTVLVSRTETNEFLDTMAVDAQELSRLALFNNFKSSLNISDAIFSNNLCSTYVLKIKGKKVGIACMNSVWRANGGPEDYGKLIIGERQIDDCDRALDGCDIKIAMLHHPPEWLMEFDRRDSKRLLLSKFQVVLFGHLHESEPQSLTTVSGTSLISQAGCLYQSRDYFNGYTLITFDIADFSGKALLRTYFDKRPAFDQAVNIAPRGEYIFLIKPQVRMVEDKTLEIIDALDIIISNRASKQLLSTTVDSIAPKQIRDIFVEPLLKSVPQPKFDVSRARALKSNDDTPSITIDSLLSADNHQLIIGGKESGKTTLLNYMASRLTQNEDISKMQYPLYVSFRDLPAGKEPVLRQIKNNLEDSGVKLDVENMLDNGQCVILVDDFIVGSRKQEKLVAFIERFKNNRFIFAMEEVLSTRLGIDVDPKLGIDLFPVYIYSFTRNHIRKLIQKWFKAIEVDVEKILDSAMQSMANMNIPRTPVIASLLLWIIEKYGNFVPLNKASLLEKFIEISLEKTKASRQLDYIDYRIKEHFLSHVASEMVVKEQYKFPRIGIEAIAIEYFGKRGLSTPVSPFIDYFISKGVLIEHEGIIQFKFQCFCEFFIARRMMNDNAFYAYILDESRYLAFVNEIDYLSGLQRDNLGLLKVVYERMSKLISGSPLDIELGLYEHLDVQKSLASKDESTSFIQSLQPKVMADSERDRVMDCMYAPYNCDQSVERKSNVSDGSKCLYNLELLSRVIRNSELVDELEFKINVFSETIQTWTKLLLIMSIIVEQCFKEPIESTLTQKEVSEALGVIQLVLPIGFQYIILQALGSDKIDALILGAIKKPHLSVLEKFLLVWLYADLKLPNYIVILRNTILAFNDKFVIQLCILRLNIFYSLNVLNDGERHEIEDLMADVLIRSQKSRRKGRTDKSKVLKAIKEYWKKFKMQLNVEA